MEEENFRSGRCGRNSACRECTYCIARRDASTRRVGSFHDFENQTGFLRSKRLIAHSEDLVLVFYRKIDSRPAGGRTKPHITMTHEPISRVLTVTQQALSEHRIAIYVFISTAEAVFGATDLHNTKPAETWVPRRTSN